MNPRRLYRCRHDRQLAGVAAGIAEYLDMDPTVVRVLWVVSAFFGGITILLYIILAFVMPFEPATAAAPGAWAAAGPTATVPPAGGVGTRPTAAEPIAPEPSRRRAEPGGAEPIRGRAVRVDRRRRSAHRRRAVIGAPFLILGLLLFAERHRRRSGQGTGTRRGRRVRAVAPPPGHLARDPGDPPRILGGDDRVRPRGRGVLVGRLAAGDRDRRRLHRPSPSRSADWSPGSSAGGPAWRTRGRSDRTPIAPTARAGATCCRPCSSTRAAGSTSCTCSWRSR